MNFICLQAFCFFFFFVTPVFAGDAVLEEIIPTSKGLPLIGMTNRQLFPGMDFPLQSATEGKKLTASLPTGLSARLLKRSDTPSVSAEDQKNSRKELVVASSRVSNVIKGQSGSGMSLPGLSSPVGASESKPNQDGGERKKQLSYQNSFPVPYSVSSSAASSSFLRTAEENQSPTDVMPITLRPRLTIQSPLPVMKAPPQSPPSIPQRQHLSSDPLLSAASSKTTTVSRLGSKPRRLAPLSSRDPRDGEGSVAK